MSKTVEQAKNKLTEELKASLKKATNPLMSSPFAVFNVDALVDAIDALIEAKLNAAKLIGNPLVPQGFTTSEANDK